MSASAESDIVLFFPNALEPFSLCSAAAAAVVVGASAMLPNGSGLPRLVSYDTLPPCERAKRSTSDRVGASSDSVLSEGVWPAVVGERGVIGGEGGATSLTTLGWFRTVEDDVEGGDPAGVGGGA